jgi:hypothetical protein
MCNTVRAAACESNLEQLILLQMIYPHSAKTIQGSKQVVTLTAATMPTTSSPIKIRSAAGSTFAKAPSAAVTPAAEVATIISGRTTMSEPQPKHAPKTPKGTEFKWDANGAIRSKPFKVNEPAALSLKLVDTVGTTHTFNYPSQIIDWTSKEAVLKANTWYGQLISRKLNRPNPVCASWRPISF